MYVARNCSFVPIVLVVPTLAVNASGELADLQGQLVVRGRHPLPMHETASAGSVALPWHTPAAHASHVVCRPSHAFTCQPA